MRSSLMITAVMQGGIRFKDIDQQRAGYKGIDQCRYPIKSFRPVFCSKYDQRADPAPGQAEQALRLISLTMRRDSSLS